MTTYIVTDSRGRRLEHYLRGKPRISRSDITFLQVICCSIPGATTTKVQVHLTQHLSRVNPDTIIIAIGICNLTTKTVLNGRNILLYETNKEKREEIVKGTCDGLEDIKAVHEDEQRKVLFATFPPCSLVKYFTSRNPGAQVPEYLIEEQEALIQDVEEINSTIKRINEESNYPTIDWDKYVYHQSVKRRRSGTVRKKIRRFVDLNLPDGLHFNDKLQDQVFNRLYQQIRSLQNQDQPADLDTSQDTTSGEESGWQLKRRVRVKENPETPASN